MNEHIPHGCTTTTLIFYYMKSRPYIDRRTRALNGDWDRDSRFTTGWSVIVALLDLLVDRWKNINTKQSTIVNGQVHWIEEFKDK